MQTDADIQPLAGFQNQLHIRNSSCENELEELMHQIDIMVSHRKVEWEKHVKVLEQKLEAQDRELTEARNLVDEKNHEIGILCKKLEGVDTAQHEMAQNYERQLQALKFQLCKLKKSYEKLHFHQEKHQKNENAAQERSRCELQWLTQKIEEFKARSREWEKQRVFYQDQLKSLDEQRKTLAEKCQLFQNMEAQLYKAKLELQSRNDLLRVPALEERQAQKETANWVNQKTAQGEEASFQVTDPRMNYMTSEPEHKSFNLSKSEKYQAENDLHGTEAKNSDLERLRKDIGDLTAKLNQKDVTIATVSRKVSRLERELELKGAQNRQTSMPLSQKDVIAELESEMPQIHAVNKAPQTDSGEVDPWISIKCGEHDKPQKHRSFHGENNSLKPTNYADTRNHSVGSEWESEKSLCPWNTPTLGSATDDDCDLVDNENEWLSLYNSILYPGLDLPPISYACDQLKDSTNSVSNVTEPVPLYPSS